jgi:hypothetical protein
MSNAKMKAVDTLHVSAAGPENIEGGQIFEVNETEAKLLEDRGLATRVGAKAQSAAPANKMQAAPDNKSVPARILAAPAKPARSGK